ncbi:MAG: cardiolipin synthase [Muribaculaceae bacterium]|nr:cardiolipin synthase [Muribaculaceae bacterium]
MMEAIHEILREPWFYTTLSLTYVLSIITVILVIIGENRNPVKSLAWVTVLILLPAVGLVLYIFFGRNIKNKRMISRRTKRRLLKKIKSPRNSSTPPAEYRPLAKLAQTILGSPYLSGNEVDIFSLGTSKFESLAEDLRHARKFINLQYYIFQDDELGREIAAILKERARVGVKVRVIYDHVGSFSVRSDFFKQLKAAGVEAYPFFKVAFLPFASKVNWRNHRKIVIIDGEIGYIGGMNIANRYLDGGKFPLWRDCHLRLEGPAVASLQYSFARDWSFMRDEVLDQECTFEARGDVGVQAITGGPMSQWNSIAHVFMRAIIGAKKRIFLQTPYFLPPETLLKALQNAALSGIDVRIMMPRKSDSWMLSLSTRSYIAECLRAGIKIYFFRPGMLHSKVLIIDDNLSSVGSTNFDFRSFEHNFEANVILYSEEINERLRGIFLNDQSHSDRIYPDAWKRRPRLQRALESIVRLLAPIL